jgi:hypothetical protein
MCGIVGCWEYLEWWLHLLVRDIHRDVVDGDDDDDDEEEEEEEDVDVDGEVWWWWSEEEEEEEMRRGLLLSEWAVCTSIVDVVVVNIRVGVIVTEEEDDDDDEGGAGDSNEVQSLSEVFDTAAELILWEWGEEDNVDIVVDVAVVVAVVACFDILSRDEEVDGIECVILCLRLVRVRVLLGELCMLSKERHERTMKMKMKMMKMTVEDNQPKTIKQTSE